MVRDLAVLLIAGVLTIGMRSPAHSAAGPATQTRARSDIRGVWKVTESLSRAPGEAWTTLTPGSSSYIFTAKHYSYMFTVGATPRRLFAGDPNQPSDVEKAGAYDSFVAASGTYTLSGPTLVLEATLHKNPNEMTGEPLSYAVEIDGNTLRMTIVNPPFSPGRERRTVLTRIE